MWRYGGWRKKVHVSNGERFRGALWPFEIVIAKSEIEIAKSEFVIAKSEFVIAKSEFVKAK